MVSAIYIPVDTRLYSLSPCHPTSFLITLGILVIVKGPDNLQADDAFELVSFEADLSLSMPMMAKWPEVEHTQPRSSPTVA